MLPSTSMQFYYNFSNIVLNICAKADGRKALSNYSLFDKRSSALSFKTKSYVSLEKVSELTLDRFQVAP